ncbi:hypothetical protein BHM03_00034891 [Ensete ventricosum]|uniref:Uncharacterized protein n=1 Tax=Ensete ventricosum TaxID=4639 RepID=A0A445MJ40_ENSVE|nr:hypothetical protein BHM03_00034891 [Ensete ventricosum]
MSAPTLRWDLFIKQASPILLQLVEVAFPFPATASPLTATADGPCRISHPLHVKPRVTPARSLVQSPSHLPSAPVVRRDRESDSGHGDGLYHDAMHALTVHQRRSRAEDSHPLVRACAMGDQRLCATRRRRLLPSTTDRGERGRRQ